MVLLDSQLACSSHLHENTNSHLVTTGDDTIAQVSGLVDVRRSRVYGMEAAAMLDTSAATAALSRRRKQSRPRQLASSVDDDDTAVDNQQGTAGSLTVALRISVALAHVTYCYTTHSGLEGKRSVYSVVRITGVVCNFGGAIAIHYAYL